MGKVGFFTRLFKKKSVDVNTREEFKIGDEVYAYFIYHKAYHNGVGRYKKGVIYRINTSSESLDLNKTTYAILFEGDMEHFTAKQISKTKKKLRHKILSHDLFYSIKKVKK